MSDLVDASQQIGDELGGEAEVIGGGREDERDAVLAGEILCGREVRSHLPNLATAFLIRQGVRA